MGRSFLLAGLGGCLGFGRISGASHVDYLDLLLAELGEAQGADEDGGLARVVMGARGPRVRLRVVRGQGRLGQLLPGPDELDGGHVGQAPY